jgi:5-methylcytosine-specific restriction endonuclease McrA
MRLFKKRELPPTEKAEEIFRKNYIFCREDQIVEGKNPLAITKLHSIFTGGKIEYALWNIDGYESGYSFSKEEIIKAIIACKHNWKKSIDLLINSAEKNAEKEHEKNELREEIEKIKERERKRKLREKAEKKLYGKKKTTRVNIPSDEKEMILSKFNNQCVVCNQTEGLHIHHKDHNPSNNKMENLVVLCGVCHKKAHMKVR